MPQICPCKNKDSRTGIPKKGNGLVITKDRKRDTACQLNDYFNQILNPFQWDLTEAMRNDTELGPNIQTIRPNQQTLSLE